MTEIALDPRLATIAEMLGNCRCVADIGTDHGRLGAHLLQHGRCEHVQFLDISADSLAKARALIERLSLLERASFGVGDGAAAMTRPADAVVVAGMGGLLIADILEAGVDRLRDAKLVLQPNVAQRSLRERIMRLGFAIEDERLVKAGGRYYVIIAARAGTSRYGERELIVGPQLLAQRPPLLQEYAKRQLRIAKSAHHGAMQGDAPWTEARKSEVMAWEAIVDESGECP